MAIKYCSQCGKPIYDDAKVCPYCNSIIDPLAESDSAPEPAPAPAPAPVPVAVPAPAPIAAPVAVPVATPAEAPAPAPVAAPAPAPDKKSKKPKKEKKEKQPKKKSKKKVLAIVIPILVVLLLAGTAVFFYFFSPVTVPWLCSHNYSKATCVKAAKCYRCDATKGKPSGHKWDEATCTEPKTCSVCDKTEGDPLGHDYIDPTCTEPEKCSRCDETFKAALGHKWEAADCTSPKKCSVCGQTDGSALGHKWKDATCFDPKTCTVCGTTDGTRLGHDMVNDICLRPGCTYTTMNEAKTKSYVQVTGLDWTLTSSQIQVPITIQNPSSSRSITGFSFEITFYNKDDVKLRADGGTNPTSYTIENVYISPNSKSSYTCYLNAHFAENPSRFSFEKCTIYFDDGTYTVISTPNTKYLFTWW